jgi:hypothetical protein
MGELELRRGDRKTAREHFSSALALARNPMEHRFLSQRVSACESIDAWPDQSAAATKRRPTTEVVWPPRLPGRQTATNVTD